ncbi:hypothetical protein VPH35_017555 [Triticum aestivum]
MALVRCAARRLGGSVLQRTQAAAAEEGRRLVPSRFMRNRQLSGDHAGKFPALDSELEKNRKELEAMIAKLKNTPRPHASTLCVQYQTIKEDASNLINYFLNFPFISKGLLFLCMISAAVYGLGLDKGVEATASTRESSEDKIQN